jgi:enoyl-CoA hydratase/carnithine racemase
MEFQTIQIVFDSGIATITLNRPEKRNAISHALVDELLAAFDEVERSRPRS